jgi:peptidoglycan-associated lipoprotein
MQHPSRSAALAAALAILFGATACASRRTTSDTQSANTPVVAASPAQSGPASARETARAPEAPMAARPLPAQPPAEAASAPSTAAPTQASSFTAPNAPMALADIFFGFDESSLSNDARQVLDRNAEFLRRNPEARIQIEGHADERGSTAYNLALADRRAAAARRYLESLGIDGNRLSTISYGEEKPFVHGASEDAYSQNRRGHFLVVR